MVKSKRDLKSPRRNRSFTGTKPVPRSRTNPNFTGGNIRVVVRVRPANAREGGDLRNVVKVVDNSTIIFDPKEEDEPFFYYGVQQRNRDITKKANKNLQFNFDRVFGDDVNNEGVFKNSTKDLIQTLMSGYNCSVFVYGATGAGKTHTMLGRNNDPGITFLTMNELFQQIEELSHERDFEICMSYLEVYNENVQDLLNPGPALHLREDGRFRVVVAGIQVQRIKSSEKLFELLDQGNRNRTQHPTDANAESSRSHAVFQVYLKMKFKVTGEVRVAKLSMIDLAGSERGAATGYTGARFTEGTNINKSLLALGNCINSLAEGQRHVPYRDSKLTRLLKDSLGGNCQTVMVANVSPSSLSYEDTYNTLKYAMRAKKITLNMKKNVVNCETNINHYINIVDELTKENEELKLQLSLNSQKECNCNKTETRDAELQAELQVLYADKRELEQRVLQLESTEHLLAIRKQLKEESDMRLSGICSDTPEKAYGHRRLGNAVDRLERQAASLKEELANLHTRNEQLDARAKEFLERAPQLQQLAETENIQLACLKANNKAEHLQKVCDLQSGELRMRDQLIERFSEVLKPCFLQLRGHGHATVALTSSYQDLVRHLQGIRSVSWEDEAAPTNVIEEDNSTPNKKNLLTDDQATFDHTFVVPKTPAGDDIITKVQESPSSETSEAIALNQTHVLTKDTVDEVSAQNCMYRVPAQVATSTTSQGQGEVSAVHLMYRVPGNINKKVRICESSGDTLLNQTRVLSSNKSPIIRGNKPAVTASRVSPRKRPLCIKDASSRIAKENKATVSTLTLPRALDKVGKTFKARTVTSSVTDQSVPKRKMWHN